MVPLTVFILVVLFSVQSSGTARVASAFGPVMVVWFTVLAVMGLVHIGDDPSVLAAINPYYALNSCCRTARSAWSRWARCSWR